MKAGGALLHTAVHLAAPPFLAQREAVAPAPVGGGALAQPGCLASPALGEDGAEIPNCPAFAMVMRCSIFFFI